MNVNAAPAKLNSVPGSPPTLRGTVDALQPEVRKGVEQPKVFAMLRGDFANTSERKLMDCLDRLGY